jgi:hypothetical protein
MTTNHSYSCVVKVDELSPKDREDMFLILEEHFAGLDRVIFNRDLDEKDWVVRINDAQGHIEGFSTLKVLTQDFDGERIHGFFSGDTVLSKRFTGDPTWIPVWGDHVFAEAALLKPEKSYWVLLTATHRTYRILPVCFKEYIPNPHKPNDPRLKEILDGFVRQKFPEEYDAGSGLVVLSKSIPYKNLEDVKSKFGDHHFYTDFFRKLNPHYERGDFLCCMTELCPENLTDSCVRIVYGIRPVVAIS